MPPENQQTPQNPESRALDEQGLRAAFMAFSSPGKGARHLKDARKKLNNWLHRYCNFTKRDAEQDAQAVVAGLSLIQNAEPAAQRVLEIVGVAGRIAGTADEVKREIFAVLLGEDFSKQPPADEAPAASSKEPTAPSVTSRDEEADNGVPDVNVQKTESKKPSDVDSMFESDLPGDLRLALRWSFALPERAQQSRDKVLKAFDRLVGGVRGRRKLRADLVDLLGWVDGWLRFHPDGRMAKRDRKKYQKMRGEFFSALNTFLNPDAATRDAAPDSGRWRDRKNANEEEVAEDGLGKKKAPVEGSGSTDSDVRPEVAPAESSSTPSTQMTVLPVTTSMGSSDASPNHSRTDIPADIERMFQSNQIRDLAYAIVWCLQSPERARDLRQRLLETFDKAVHGVEGNSGRLRAWLVQLLHWTERGMLLGFNRREGSHFRREYDRRQKAFFRAFLAFFPPVATNEPPENAHETGSGPTASTSPPLTPKEAKEMWDAFYPPPTAKRATTNTTSKPPQKPSLPTMTGIGVKKQKPVTKEQAIANMSAFFRRKGGGLWGAMTREMLGEKTMQKLFPEHVKPKTEPKPKVKSVPVSKDDHKKEKHDDKDHADKKDPDKKVDDSKDDHKKDEAKEGAKGASKDKPVESPDAKKPEVKDDKKDGHKTSPDVKTEAKKPEPKEEKKAHPEAPVAPKPAAHPPVTPEKAHGHH